MNTTDFTFDIFKLTSTFYKDYPNTEYPEIMSKESRPYNCLLVSTNDYIMAIPYRTDLNEHNHFAYRFKTSKRSKNNASGLDYQKMIIITDTDYIESTGYSIDRDEYLETVKNIKRIVNEAVDYVETYKKHHSGAKPMNKWKYDRAYRFRDEMISFVDDLRNDRMPQIGLKDGLASILIATAAKKSVKERRVVNINELNKV